MAKRVINVTLGSNDAGIHFAASEDGRYAASVSSKEGKISPTMPPIRDIQATNGIIGCLPLHSTSMLIAVTKATSIGKIRGHDVYKVVDTVVLPLDSTAELSSEEKKFVSILKGALSLPGLFFSPTLDLTQTMQRNLEDKDDSPLERFQWNGFLLRSLLQLFSEEDARQVLPLTVNLICGFASCNNDVEVNGKKIGLHLLSRRSVKRAGTRLHRRGVDEEGEVANFVETEMIVEYKEGRRDSVMSYLQTRGSIPVIWKQPPNLKWNPKPLRDGTHNEEYKFFVAHMESSIKLYGRQVLIDLIDQKGKELLLGQAFRGNVENLASEHIRYVDFDFHKRCKKMNYGPLQELIEDVQEEFVSQSFFWEENGEARSTQKGVFRTNCKDCLDRTNVVQTKFARVVLASKLRHLGVLVEKQEVHEVPSLEKVFKNMWADNADAISTQYSGTGALKNDFTRSGKRTKSGLLQDGINALTRYVLNNFYDGQRQDAYDLFLGNYVVPERRENPFRNLSGPRMLLVWFMAALGLALLLFVTSSRHVEADKLSFPFSLYPVVLAIGVVGAAAFGVFKAGALFVDKPSLKPC